MNQNIIPTLGERGNGYKTSSPKHLEEVDSPKPHQSWLPNMVKTGKDKFLVTMERDESGRKIRTISVLEK